MNANARGIERILRRGPFVWKDDGIRVGIMPYKEDGGFLHYELCIEDNGKDRMIYVDPYFEGSSPALRNFLIEFSSGLAQHLYKGAGACLNDNLLRGFGPEIRAAVRGALKSYNSYVKRIIKYQ